MKIRLSTIVALASAVLAGFVLFQTSQNVQQAEHRLSTARENLSREQQTVRVLQAEWGYLNRPARIESLARRYLHMESPDPDSLVHNGAKILPSPERAQGQKDKKIVPVSIENEIALKHNEMPRKAAPVPPPAPDNANRPFKDLLRSVTGEGE